jgi:arginyl-tRNA synthetase
VPLPTIQDVDTSLLLHEEELGLIKTLAQFPFILEGSAITLEPHRVTFYLQELAAKLHSYYNKHRVLPPVESAVKSEDGFQDVPWETNGKVLGSEKEYVKDSPPPALTAARLALLRQVQTVLRNGLTLLGVSSPEKM